MLSGPRSASSLVSLFRAARAPSDRLMYVKVKSTGARTKIQARFTNSARNHILLVPVPKKGCITGPRIEAGQRVVEAMYNSATDP